MTAARAIDAILFDLAPDERLPAAMRALGVPTEFEVYDGDHTNRLAFRMQDNVLPFFGRNLDFTQP